MDSACIQELVSEVMSATKKRYTSTELHDLLAPDHSLQRVEVNVALYALQGKGLVCSTEEIPPKWSTASIPMDALDQKDGGSDRRVAIYCIVDLGNTHDCLQCLLPYAERGIVKVMAYADMAFRGYGVCPAIAVPNVHVFQSDTPDKNSADVQIIWDVCKLLEGMKQERSTRQCLFLVATKDMGFLRLKALVEQNPLNSLVFVTNWQALRVYIE